MPAHHANQKGKKTQDSSDSDTVLAEGAVMMAEHSGESSRQGVKAVGKADYEEECCSVISDEIDENFSQKCRSIRSVSAIPGSLSRLGSKINFSNSMYGLRDKSERKDQQFSQSMTRGSYAGARNQVRHT